MSATAWTGKKPAGVEKTVNVLDKLSWTVQPPLGLICGDYFRVENNFAPHHALDRGYHGILEVVEKDGKLVHIEFNEINSPSYYNRYYQNASKRRSDYCFFQATKERTAQSLKVLDNGFTAVEQQMLRENRLTGDFDLVTGASNSVKRSLLPLAAQVEALRTQPRTMYYYGYAEKLPGGLTARLQVVFQNGRIVRCFFDEIFADTPEEIDDPALKKYYRQEGERLLRIIKQSTLIPASRITGGSCGTHLLVYLDTSLTDVEIRWAARSKGINLACLSEFCTEIQPEYEHVLVLNYCDLDERTLAETVRRLGNIFIQW